MNILQHSLPISALMNMLRFLAVVIGLTVVPLMNFCHWNNDVGERPPTNEIPFWCVHQNRRRPLADVGYAVNGDDYAVNGDDMEHIASKQQ